ncbi:MAG TPA: DUF2723 domain-containing protein, partial [Clostridia bacterium]|nr:DUF2723 domain-containing protein [Clostridia bacterium]
LQYQRVDDALLVAETCLKLDPYNGQVAGLVNNLQGYKSQMGNLAPAPINDFQVLEEEVKKNPSNAQAAVDLAIILSQQPQQTSRVTQLLDSVLANPSAPAGAVIRVAQLYGQMGNWVKLEESLEKLVKAAPDSAEAWYDLAALKANLQKNAEALPALKQAIELGAKRMKSQPGARDLAAEARRDDRFAILRQTPEFKKLVP